MTIGLTRCVLLLPVSSVMIPHLLDLPWFGRCYSIQRTRIGEMMLMLKKEVSKKGTSYNALAQELLNEKKTGKTPNGGGNSLV